MSPSPLPTFIIEDIVARALREDLGDAGDLTSLHVVPADATLNTAIVARGQGVVAGVTLAEAAFRLIDPALSVNVLKDDGATLAKGETIMTVAGNARSILTAERVALNFLGRLSGIASAAAALVNVVEGTGVHITCTRKTTPLLRAFEKHAVACGGGRNHRFGLYDAVMIKDNHIAAAGGVIPALKAAKSGLGHLVKIEIEVDTIDQLKEVLAEGADVILLDNMDIETLRTAVGLAKGKAVLEASGNVRLETVRAIAETGVDVISSGALTHSAPVLDIGLDAIQ